MSAALSAAWIGFYYPHVRFHDVRWLKSAALYWDRIYRLPVAELDEPEQTLISAAEDALADARFVERARVHPGAQSEAASIFLDAISGLDTAVYRVRGTKDSVPVGQNIDWIYKEKLDTSAMELLHELRPPHHPPRT